MFPIDPIKVKETPRCGQGGKTAGAGNEAEKSPQSDASGAGCAHGALHAGSCYQHLYHTADQIPQCKGGKSYEDVP